MRKQTTSDEITFGQLVGSYRALRTNLSQKAFADLVGISEVGLRHWEMDKNRPGAKNLQKLLEVFLELGIFTSRKEEEEAREFWKASRVNIVFDEVWAKALANTRKLRPEKESRVGAAFLQPSKSLGSAEVDQDSHQKELSDQVPLAKSSTRSGTDQGTSQLDPTSPIEGEAAEGIGEGVLLSIVIPSFYIQTLLRQLQGESQRSIPQWLLVASPYLVDTRTKKEVSSPSSDIQIEDTMEKDPDLEGEDPMEKQRREILLQLQRLGLVGATTVIPAIGQQDLIAEVRGALYPSGPGDKELRYLEQRIRYYWQDRWNATIVPADLMLHAESYVREVKTLLDHSLLPSTRIRLCACLSQGMLLIGANFYDEGQFQTAREYFQTAVESAHEANHNILQALAWYRDSRSWTESNETDWYEHALDSMLKAYHFASLESDLAVQCLTQAGLAEVYAFHGEKDACLETLGRAGRLSEYGCGDWYYIHRFDPSRLKGYEGICLQQFYQPGVPETYPLLEAARQALKTALSQLNASVLQRAYYVIDMAQLHARKGEVESACDHTRQIISIAHTSASIRQKVLKVHNYLKPYADVQDVKDLDTEIRSLLLLGQQ